MSRWQDKTTDVLIVGAGPAGLMMACQLALHHIPFCIIDKNLSPAQNSGALFVQARSLEIFEKMGIASEAIREGIVADKINIFFNGKRISGTSLKATGGTLSQFPFLLMLEQSKTEKLLLNFLGEHGHSVERGIQFKSFIQEQACATSVVILPDGSENSIRSTYIIAADGGSSAVRNFLNIPFKGKSYSKPIFILDCQATTKLTPGEICFAFNRSSVSGFFPLQGGRWRVDSTLPRETENQEIISYDNVAKDFQRWTMMNFTPQTFQWFSVFHAHQRYAGTLRVQNCFLSGDAAHVHSPVGAQGMNTGLQDASNLAWKLAFVIKGEAKPELLESYALERSGISKGFARYADIIYRMVSSNNIVLQFFRLKVLGVFFKILFPLLGKQGTIHQSFFKSISQIGIQYRKSILSQHASEGKFLTDSPRAGDRWPYVGFIQKDKNTDTYAVLNATRFTLLLLVNDLSVPLLPDQKPEGDGGINTAIPAECGTKNEMVLQELQEIAKKYNLAVHSIANLPGTKKLYERLGIKNNALFLIRPDMHIAMRSASLSSHHLRIYLEQFFIAAQ